MIKVSFRILIFIWLLGCNTSVEEKNDTTQTQELNRFTDNSRTSLDWDGTYRGMLPCADCEGILLEITLSTDEQYYANMRYLGKAEGSFHHSGSFDWDATGGIITLRGLDPEDASQQYRVGENVLIKLDQNAKPITGDLASMYRLPKMQSDRDIRETYWRLIELNGKPIHASEGSRSEAHLILKVEENRIFGSTGCNRFFGTYEMEAEILRISFSKVGASLMACQDIDYEGAYLEVFERADNFSISEDGQYMSLNRARMAPLARFEAIR
jgi:heat shock protein HslJ